MDDIRIGSEVLTKALDIAVHAHDAQTDLGLQPYILHVLRVVTAQCGDYERVVAALHDVVEDTDWTLSDLRREGFNERIIAAVDALTRRAGEPYFDYVARAGGNEIARSVKIADLKDNMDPSRVCFDETHSMARRAKYQKALAILEATA